MTNLKKILCIVPNKELGSAIENAIKEEFQEKYSKIQLDFTDNYNSTISKLKEEYDFYILNDLIPKIRGAKAKQFFQGKVLYSFKLIEKILEKEGNYKKVILASSYDEILETANKIGIKKLYNKWFAKPPYQKDIKDLAEDLKKFLEV